MVGFNNGAEWDLKGHMEGGVSGYEVDIVLCHFEDILAFHVHLFRVLCWEDHYQIFT